MKHGTHSDRNKEMVRRVLKGETLRAVGKDHSISKTRVRHILNEVMYRLFVNTKRRAIRRVPLKNWRIGKNHVLNKL